MAICDHMQRAHKIAGQMVRLFLDLMKVRVKLATETNTNTFFSEWNTKLTCSSLL